MRKVGKLKSSHLAKEIVFCLVEVLISFHVQIVNITVCRKLGTRNVTQKSRVLNMLRKRFVSLGDKKGNECVLVAKTIGLYSKFYYKCK